MSVENDCNIRLTCMLPCTCYCLLDACYMRTFLHRDKVKSHIINQSFAVPGSGNNGGGEESVLGFSIVPLLIGLKIAASK